MSLIFYPAIRAAQDKADNYSINVDKMFNNIMGEIQVHTSLGQNFLEVLEVKSFQFFGLQDLFVSQGYNVTQIGFDPVLKYIINW